jgi:hypothetical protein
MGGINFVDKTANIYEVIKMRYPNGAKAALTIFDDADLGNRKNLEPIYGLLHEFGFRTTRSTWILPSRRSKNTGHFKDQDYLSWLKIIDRQGFEIALHNVGNGIYTRGEILEALDLFYDTFGKYPAVHTNHHSNPDNVYWNANERFMWPVSWLYRFLGKDKRNRYLGSLQGSPCYWSDVLSQQIRYVRNLTFNDINTLKKDPYMPYWDSKRPEVPFWFSSTDMRDIHYFARVLTADNLDRLCNQEGVCIGYTHFGTDGFLDSNGRPSSAFVKVLNEIKERNIWVAPVSEVLDFLLQNYRYYDSELTIKKSFLLSIRWVKDRQNLATIARKHL